jgi:hypothetical protein
MYELVKETKSPFTDGVMASHQLTNLSTSQCHSSLLTQTVFETHKYDIKEMMFQIHLKGMQLDAEYEMAGKNIDEMTS